MTTPPASRPFASGSLGFASANWLVQRVVKSPSEQSPMWRNILGLIMELRFLNDLDFWEFRGESLDPGIRVSTESLFSRFECASIELVCTHQSANSGVLSVAK